MPVSLQYTIKKLILNFFSSSSQVNHLLKAMTAETLENEVGVVDLPDLTQVKFTLLGENKIDIAYQLEEKVILLARIGGSFCNLMF